jgi:hypothetical protein
VGAAVVKRAHKPRAGTGKLSAGAKRKPVKLAALVVEERRKLFEAGQDWALLDAADFCARTGMVMPKWLANAFCERYLDWYLFRAKTLDTAFGVKRGKGMHVDDRMHREWLKPRVVLEVLRLTDPEGEDMAFDERLFACVGKKFGIKKTLANEVYYDADNHWRTLLPRIFRSSRQY